MVFVIEMSNDVIWFVAPKAHFRPVVEIPYVNFVLSGSDDGYEFYEPLWRHQRISEPFSPPLNLFPPPCFRPFRENSTIICSTGTFFPALVFDHLKTRAGKKVRISAHCYSGNRPLVGIRWSFGIHNLRTMEFISGSVPSHCGPLPYSVNRFGGDFWSKRVAVCNDFVQAYCNDHLSHPNQILGHTRQIPFKTDHRNRFSKNNVLNSSEVKNTTRNSINRIS